ncbi:EF-P lysine aminoacylase GenX [Rhodoferax sp. 4810]|uniref:EF-P lysine aminoacylase GenX n=1 Tax=Thiospirillum jenense TaxID=1653858 RepID=A0A839HBA9_9GAMM|nr:EF-P lysine aminoacylase EpmA [Thiospirillum jenense]MBB1076538.1 EF-P lysine aminoacylase GenX [Rhodoferax jenense]MBB1124756.1 EF-P lysine aminoacylase GenX [Thiospirillum jenense]
MIPAISPPIDHTWLPCADLATQRRRAQLYADLREFFAERAVLEVETPLLSRAATTDPALASLMTQCHLPGQSNNELANYWLHTSPEFPMKRLLAAGSGAIYQVCKVFRDHERGARHHPEFTLLEWYRPDWTLAHLMDEMVELLRTLWQRPDLPTKRYSYRALFQQFLGIDPWHLKIETLPHHAIAHGIGGAETLELTPDGWLDLLFTHCIEPHLGQMGCLTFVCDYPPSQAALARLNKDGDITTARRFELYQYGMELANGFEELTDANEQQQRFQNDLQTRAEQNQLIVPMDTALLQALADGLPNTAGVALGIDRLLMLITGKTTIDEVLAFPIERA